MKIKSSKDKYTSLLLIVLVAFLSFSTYMKILNCTYITIEINIMHCDIISFFRSKDDVRKYSTYFQIYDRQRESTGENEMKLNTNRERKKK